MLSKRNDNYEDSNPELSLEILQLKVEIRS